MFRTLRRRLIASHVLPLLVVIPLMGIALIYVLETQVLIPSLTSELFGQASLVAEDAQDQPGIWSDPMQARAFVMRLDPLLDARLMLIGPQGQILASTYAADREQIGQFLNHPGLSTVLMGKTSVHEDYSPSLESEIADVLMPVMAPDEHVEGVVRLSYILTNVYQRFLVLRFIIGGVIVGGIVLGVAVGSGLAVNLERPLKSVTTAVYQLAQGERTTPVPDQGPEEISLLSRAFNTLLDRLRSLETARSQLLANLVHELGRPLGAVRSAIQALQGGAEQDATLRREMLTGIDDEVKRLQRLLVDLAHLHEQVLGSLELDRQSVVLNEWLPHVLVPWREAALKKKIHWEEHLPDDLPVLRYDPDRLAQAVGNLLSNAVKYTPLGGTVSVSASIEDESFAIRVEDTGPGMSAEQLAHIFEPFYRGQTTRRFPQGMGLGLTIARDLATAHGGQLDVTSTPGLGTQFVLRIPCGRPRD